MTILERVSADIISAMKNKDELKLSTLRLVRSAFKNRQIEVGHELSEEEVLTVMKSMKKQFLDALSDFEKGGRQDLVEKQNKEIAVLDEYLPKAMPQDELERIVEEAVKASGVTSSSDFGKAMGAAVKAVEGRAEGNAIREIVQRLLS